MLADMQSLWPFAIGVPEYPMTAHLSLDLNWAHIRGLYDPLPEACVRKLICKERYKRQSTRFPLKTRTLYYQVMSLKASLYMKLQLGAGLQQRDRGHLNCVIFPLKKVLLTTFKVPYALMTL